MPSSQDESEVTYPDVLEVLAVDRVDDAVGANELDSTVNVDIYHRATLTVLGEGESFPQGCHGTPHQDSPKRPPLPNQAAFLQTRVGAERLKTQDGMGTRDSRLNAYGGPHPGVPQTGPLV